MNNLELPPFYIGQKVVYITGKKMPKDSIHTVSDIQKKTCGCHWSIAIDGNKLSLNPPDPGYDYFTCRHCKKHTLLGWTSNPAWAASSFRPIQQAQTPSLSFTRIREVEKEQVLLPN